MSLAIRRRADSAVSIIGGIVHEVRRRDVPFMAGSIAYYAFLSLVPLVLLLFLFVSFVGNERLAAFVDAATEAYLTPTAQSVLIETIREASGRAQLSVIAVLTLLWGITSVFRGLDTAFSKLYDTEGAESFLEKTINGLIVLGGISIAVVAMFLAGFVYALFQGLPFMPVLNLVFLTIALAIAFLPIYYVFPDVDVTVPEILPGAVVAAVGWTLLQFLFQVYASLSSAAELYGALGGVLLLITWLYFGALVLLLGGVTNVVLAGRYHVDDEDSSSATADRQDG
ncbi:MAG: YihY/virulence factor BrkB family protein [Halorientalis sp.]